MKHFTASKRTRLLPLAVALVAISVAPAFAQDQDTSTKLHGFWVTTPYPELAIQPGDKESIPVTLKNAGMPPERAQLSVSGIPSDWTWDLKGGGREVTAAIVEPDDSQRLQLEVTAPNGAAEKSYPITVTAKYDGKTAELPMTISVSEGATGGVELSADLPALSGTPKSKFSYKIKVANNGTEDALYNLSADVPTGFQTHFKQGYGSEEITGLPVKAGESADLTMEVQPPSTVAAGRYPVTLQVADGDETAETQLSMEVTGQPEIEMQGPQGRLSGSATAGQDTSYTFTIANSGSAPLQDVTVSATPPQGWKVSAEPDTIPELDPGTKQDVNVTFHPSEQAIAGDYMVSLRASSGSVSDTEQFRVTVETATIWGAVGLAVIAAAVVILGLAIMRYGRR